MRRMLRMNLFLGISVLFILTIAGLVFSSDELPLIKGVLSLKESIRIALKNSTLIQERKEAILQAMAETEANYADFWPKVSTGYSYSGLSEEPFMNFGGQKIPTSTRDNYRWDVTLVTNTYYPEVAFVGKYERMGDTPEINGNNLTNKEMGSIILQVRWTFFEWGKTKSEVRKAESRKLDSVLHSMTQD